MQSIDHAILIQDTQKILNSSQDASFFSTNANYELLLSVIIDHNHLYYIKNNPIISDHDYDKIFQLLQHFEELHPELIRDDSPTQGLQGQYEVQSGFAKSHHNIPILSLQNSYNTEDIRSWYETLINILQKNNKDISNLKFVLEPKYDGLSIVLSYNNGKLIKAVTRGDGYTGDEVTANIQTIKNLPKTISLLDPIILRGEVMMSKSERKRLNKERQEDGEIPFANTRNAAAGSLKLLDTNIVAQRKLICYVYDILQGPSDSNAEFQNLNSLTTTTSGYTIDEIINNINNNNIREKLLTQEVDFDGLVIKLLGDDLRMIVGSTAHHPRRAIAYKFPAQQATTQIVDISRQVGRTRILTPVALVNPVQLSGATLSRVSLHNRDFITNKDIQINDRIRLQRSGEVIPYIVSVIKDKRDGTQYKYELNKIHCPACNTPAKIITHQVGSKSKPSYSTQIMCQNPTCPGVLKEQLIHFVSKNALDINTLGEATINLLVDQGLLQSLTDLYTLDTPNKQFTMKRLPGLGEKKITILIEELHESRHKPLWRLLNALGIPGIGVKLAKDIEKSLISRPENPKTLSSIFSIITNPKFLNNIYGVGEKIIQDMLQRYQDNQSMIKTLEYYKVNPSLLSQKNTHKKHTKTIAITGTFSLTRSELNYYIQEAGFQFVTTVNKHTDYLFVGHNPGSKIQKIGPHTKIISNIEEIYSLLNISTPLFNENPIHTSPQTGTMQSLFE